ncbi:C40 family peptidase [Streptomyces sp. 8L]|uniref:C40 family peptidase n=1 Tax=Streptomyces sp. 8L TaxID=2877242 RepID=UPI001CD4C7D6|nr:NlpC/P60 family protein [Streptomyces sp. 8L]MCA1223918.1 NlpC/P60 family protein [Streptomyces sp. 8L]
MRLAVGAAGLILLALAVSSAVAAHLSALAQTDSQNAASSCPASEQGSEAVDAAQVTQQVRAVLAGSTATIHVPGLSDAEQVTNAKTIVATGAQLHVPARGQVIALATALQESTLHNRAGGDRDSLGLFQQRPSQGWGSAAQILDPVYASTRFYRALLSVRGWQTMPLSQAAQTVQKSGTPDAYAKHEALATALQRAIAPTLGAGAAGRTADLNSPPATVGISTACGMPSVSTYSSTPAGTVPAGYHLPADAPAQVRTAIQWALGQLATPYQWGGSCTNPHGNNPRDRCDCSSLVQRAYGVAGIQLTRTTYTQIRDGRAVPLTALKAGDLVFTEGSAARPEHVALYMGDGLVVQAPHTGAVVDVVKITANGTVLAARRVV